MKKILPALVVVGFVLGAIVTLALLPEEIQGLERVLIVGVGGKIVADIVGILVPLMARSR